MAEPGSPTRSSQRMLRLDGPRGIEGVLEELGGPDSVHGRMFELATSSHMLETQAAIKAVAGYELPPSASLAFDRYFRYLGVGGIEPLPEFVCAAESQAKWGRWYRQHRKGIEDASSALCGAYYHRDNIVAMESQIAEIVTKTGLRDLMAPGSAVGGGNSRRLDFEYHGFLSASRRCLDYMTRGVAAFFRNEQTSFRSFIDGLGTKSDRWQPIALRLREAYARHCGNFPDLLSEGDVSRSLRDRLNHLEHLHAGTINITSRGVLVCGGAEDLSPLDEAEALLTTVLDAKLTRLQGCVDDVVDSFVEAARQAFAATSH